jgi:hypothetical protein
MPAHRIAWVGHGANKGIGFETARRRDLGQSAAAKLGKSAVFIEDDVLTSPASTAQRKKLPRKRTTSMCS